MRDNLLEICSNQEAHNGLGWAVGEKEIVFYDNNGRMMGRNHIWVQGTLMTLVWIFDQVGIYTNLGKTKSMVCTPGFIWGEMGKEAYNQQAMGEGATLKEQNRTRVSCRERRVTMEASYLQQHVASIHGRSLLHKREVDNGVWGRDTYRVSFHRFLNSVAYMIEGFSLREKIPVRVWDHFMY